MTGWSARPRVIRILAALAALGLVLAVVGLVVPRAFGNDSTADDEDRKQVISRASDFAVTYNTYDVADLPGYQKRLKGLLTPKYNEQFVQVTNAVFTALEEKKQKSGEAKVLGVAIDTIDNDSAEAIVAVDSTITNTDNKAAVVRHFRWRLSFNKTKGDWLISNFESVAAVTAQAEDAPVTPAPATPSPDTTDGGKK